LILENLINLESRKPGEPDKPDKNGELMEQENQINLETWRT